MHLRLPLLAPETLLPGGTLPAEPPEPPPSPRPADRPSKITCDFCKCTLVASNGDIFKMSPEAKTYRDLEDEVERLRADVLALQTTSDTVTRERDEARAALTTPIKRSGIFGS